MGGACAEGSAHLCFVRVLAPGVWTGWEGVELGGAHWGRGELGCKGSEASATGRGWDCLGHPEPLSDALVFIQGLEFLEKGGGGGPRRQLMGSR